MVSSGVWAQPTSMPAQQTELLEQLKDANAKLEKELQEHKKTPGKMWGFPSPVCKELYDELLHNTRLQLQVLKQKPELAAAIPNINKEMRGMLKVCSPKRVDYPKTDEERLKILLTEISPETHKEIEKHLRTNFTPGHVLKFLGWCAQIHNTNQPTPPICRALTKII